MIYLQYTISHLEHHHDILIVSACIESALRHLMKRKKSPERAVRELRELIDFKTETCT